MDEPKPQDSTNNNENAMRAVIVSLIICMILAVLGTGFGIYGSIQANRALGIIEQKSDEDDESSDENSYGKPTNADEIQYITIAYNDIKDYVDISREEGTIDYYTYNADEEYVGDPIETNVTDIINYIFDNDLQYLGDNDYLDNTTWAIEITSDQGYSYVSGESDPPEWFNALLKKLDVDKKGYKSKSL